MTKTSTIGKPEAAAGLTAAAGAALTFLANAQAFPTRLAASTVGTDTKLGAGAIILAGLGYLGHHAVSGKKGSDVEERLEQLEAAIEKVEPTAAKVATGILADLPTSLQAEIRAQIDRWKDDVGGWVLGLEGRVKAVETKAAAKAGIDPDKLRALLDDGAAEVLPSQDVAEADKVIADVTPAPAVLPAEPASPEATEPVPLNAAAAEAESVQV